MNKGDRGCGTVCPQTLAHSLPFISQILKLSEFAPLLREIAPGPLNTPSAPGIIHPVMGGGGQFLVDHIDGNLGPSSVYPFCL